MKRWAAWSGFVGLGVCILLTPVSPAEAGWRCRGRSRCPIVMPACAGGQYPRCGCCRYPDCYETYYCMVCEGGFWQIADPGQTCVRLPESKLGQPCGYGPKEPKRPKEPNKAPHRILKGCGLYYDISDGYWHWRSDIESNDHCSTEYIWSSQHVNLNHTNRVGRCPEQPGGPVLYKYDIAVTD
jgi:hypothetical protein